MKQLVGAIWLNGIIYIHSTYYFFNVYKLGRFYLCLVHPIFFSKKETTEN